MADRDALPPRIGDRIVPPGLATRIPSREGLADGPEALRSDRRGELRILLGDADMFRGDTLATKASDGASPFREDPRVLRGELASALAKRDSRPGDASRSELAAICSELSSTFLIEPDKSSRLPVRRCLPAPCRVLSGEYNRMLLSR